MPAGVENDFQLATYYPIFLYLGIILAFAGVTLVAAHLPFLKPQRRTAVKLMPYESGMDPIGDARQRFDVKFYLIAILFLVFDVELLFLYPWAVVAYREPASDAAGRLQRARLLGGARLPGHPGRGLRLRLAERGVSMAVKLPDNVVVTRLDHLANWVRKNSLWPMPFATACCGIELMATGASRHDIARFGAEVMRFSPRQCDLMIVAGRVVMKMMPVLQRIWLQMPEPKWCISMGACASSGGVFDTYAVVQGIDRFMPVDVYVPGCPPRPEQIIQVDHRPAGQDPADRHAHRQGVRQRVPSRKRPGRWRRALTRHEAVVAPGDFATRDAAARRCARYESDHGDDGRYERRS